MIFVWTDQALKSLVDFILCGEDWTMTIVRVAQIWQIKYSVFQTDILKDGVLFLKLIFDISKIL